MCSYLKLEKYLPPALLSLVLLGVWPVQAMQDPTRPPVAEATARAVAVQQNSSPRWTLHSTLVSSARRTAVINDRVVSQGDRINGATVVSIQPAAVLLRVAGRELRLGMEKKNIKSLSRTDSAGHSAVPSVVQGK
ncbi:MAG: hypothetical protein RRB22_04775 [Gammaproteobacteria bacterium]|nr:hypothetical protein [Gammaproteobacteria bacterium]